MDVVESPDATAEAERSSTGHLNGSQKRRYSECSHDDHPTREYGVMRDTRNGKDDTARFIGSGSGIHFIRSVYLRLVRKSILTRSSRSSGQIDDLIPGEDDQLGRRDSPSQYSGDAYLWKVHEVSSEDEVDDSHVSFEQLVDWSKSYFEAWHPALPFLNAPSILDLFEKISSSGMAALGNTDRVIIKSIMSISLADSRQCTAFSQPVPRSLVFSSVEEAIAASQFALSQPAFMPAIQAALAIQLFLLSMLRLNSASRLGGLIVRSE